VPPPAKLVIIDLDRFCPDSAFTGQAQPLLAWLSEPRRWRFALLWPATVIYVQSDDDDMSGFWCWYLLLLAACRLVALLVADAGCWGAHTMFVVRTTLL